MTTPVRVRFAPSPTGKVHIGNIRVAIFNWLFARHEGGAFLLRVEDTDLERSTPEAVAALFEAMAWLGLDHDGAPVHQSAQRPRHEAAADRMLNLEHAYRNSDALPATVFMIHKDLYDPSFVTDPEEDAVIDTSKAFALRGTARNLVIVDRNEKTGQEFVRPVPWDAIEAGLTLRREDGGTVDGARLRESVLEKCGTNLSEEASCDIAEIAEGKVVSVAFRRRYVFFDDLILGRRQKALDDLRDIVVVRGDGSPVFHLANVVDDHTMEVTHILRGNDHLENTFRHLFLFKALGAEPPRYGHFPMIVNEQGRPYSKRDGDAYVGDFREKGFLPEALFNFLALCGWSPGDDREMLRRDELVEAFTLDRVHNAPAQFNREKLEWLNGCYIRELAEEELLPLLQEEIRGAGGVPEDFAEDWWRKLVTVQRERLKTVRDFAAKSAFFFSDAVTINWDDKKTRKAAGKEEALTVLRELKGRLEILPEWTEAAIEAVVTEYATVSGLKMGAIAQPLRVAVTGGTVSPGIQETLFLVGRDRTLKRIDAAIAAIEERLRGA